MQDRVIKPVPGAIAFVGMVLGLAGISYFIMHVAAEHQAATWQVLLIPFLSVIWLVCWMGFKINNPNTVSVVQFFGNYVGTVREVGFFWINPLSFTKKVSLRVRTFETDVSKASALKVNDKDGTPIEIAAVVVWRVVDAAKAEFDVDDYEHFVRVQADSALRTLASQYSYDAPEADSHSLRGHITEVAEQLRNELHARMQQAGVEVQEARISKLAYAPEIASAMLQRQQAGAIIAARSRIVEGAVGMVEHALQMLNEKNIIELDAERKAAMVSNLLVVLCGHGPPQPVLNAGTLHN